jgi:hypothetical protein
MKELTVFVKRTVSRDTEPNNSGLTIQRYEHKDVCTVFHWLTTDESASRAALD